MSSKFRLWRWWIIFSCFALLWWPGPSAEAQSTQRRSFDLGTSATSDISHAIGVSLAALVKLKLLPTTGIDINARNTLGSRDNIRLLRENELQFAILTSHDAYRMMRDGDDTSGPGPMWLANLWLDAYCIVVRSEFGPTGNIADLSNLRGRPVAFGTAGSDLLANIQALLNAFELDAARDFKLRDLNRADAIDAFLNGDLDALVLQTKLPDSEIASFFERAGGSATLLDFSNEDIETANGGDLNLWTSVEVQANSFPGPVDTLQTIGMGNLLFANAEVDDDVAYQFTKAIFDNLPFLRELHPATKGISIENTLQAPAIPAHPGAETYYQEVGITLPEPNPIKVSNLTETSFLTRFQTVDEARTRLNNGTITVLGGQANETVDRVINELSSGLRDSDIRVVGMTSPSPADNIADVLYAKGVDSAVVPLDILNYARDQDVYPGMANKLVYATEMFSQELHLIAAETIRNIEELTDKPVNLGPRGSSSEFTASFLFDALNIPINPTFHDRRKALELLKTGELAAAVFVSGRPMPLLQEIQRDHGLRFLAVPPLEGPAYRPETITHNDYPAILAPGETVGTFGVRSALITYNWRTDNPRFAALSDFVTTLFDQLPSLRENAVGLHPKWRDIDPLAELEGWRRFPASQSWLEDLDGPDAAPDQDGG